MRYLRRRSSPGLLALLAFAMQVALVLGQTHVHSHSYSQAGAHAWAQGVVSLACRSITRQGCPTPAIPNDHHHDCPMCCSLAAAGTAVLPALPTVSLSAPRFEVLRPLRLAEALPDTATVNFQARAPPVT